MILLDHENSYVGNSSMMINIAKKYLIFQQLVSVFYIIILIAR